jgi:carbamoyl-phosphate synthase large subunit
MDKIRAIPLARDFQELGFEIIATSGTASLLTENGVAARSIFKVGEGRPNVVDAIKNGEVQLVINTPLGAQSRFDEYDIGRSAIRYKIPAITTISGAQAAVRGIRNIKNGSIQYRSLQDVFG